jgi:hypothetical protein
MNTANVMLTDEISNVTDLNFNVILFNGATETIKGRNREQALHNANLSGDNKWMVVECKQESSLRIFS